MADPIAPATMGGVVATLGVIEVGKLIGGQPDTALIDRQLYIDASHHNYDVTRIVQNSECRFDHRTWSVEPLGDLSLAAALALAGGALEKSKLALGEDVFVGVVRCHGCGAEHSIWRPRTRIPAADQHCAACGCELAPTGLALHEALSRVNVPSELLEAPLSAFGVEPHDVLAIYGEQGGQRYERIDLESETSTTGATVMLVGCGNIGSHVSPQLARLPGVGRILLVDPDTYEPRNLVGQDIRPTDIGRRKVDVQAERIRAIAPGVEVVAIASPLEAVAMGRFRDAVLVGALDSRRARMDLNTRACRVGSRWIDLAVHGSELLGRVSVYQPGPEAACGICSWNEDDYGLVEQRLSCAYAVGRNTAAPS